MGLYEDLVDFLWDGAVPADEIRKADDPSEVHVNQPLRTKIKHKRQAWREKDTSQKIGLATSVGGAVAGPAAVYASVKSAREGRGGLPRDVIRTAGGERGKRFAAYLDTPQSRPAKAAAAGASVGMVGLQSANWIGDAVNSRELSRTKKEMVREIKKGTRNPNNIVRNAQRVVGLAGGGAVAGAGYVAGRRATGDAVSDELDARGIRHRRTGVPRLRPRAAADPNASADVVITSQHKKDVQKMDSDLGWEGEITKVDDDKRLIFGWCSLSTIDGEPVVDRQGDWIPLEETEKAAYEYVVKSRKGGDMHKRDAMNVALHKSDMVESFVVTPEKLEKMGLASDALPHGWWVGFRVNDEELWSDVKKGHKVHLSIHGRGKRIQKEIV